jgi:hypothetical protein
MQERSKSEWDKGKEGEALNFVLFSLNILRSSRTIGCR